MKKLLSVYKNSFSGLDRIIWLLSAVMLVNRVGSMVLLFLSLYLTKELHFSLSQVGVVMGVYGAGSIVGSYIGGWLTDRYDYYKIMVWSLIISGFILPLLVFVKDYYGIMAIVFSYSVVADAFRPANSVAIGYYSDETNKTRSFSLMRMAINLGFTIGPAIGGFVAAYASYDLLFILDGVTSMLAAVFILLFIPHNKVNPKKQDEEGEKEVGLSAYKDHVYLMFIVLVSCYAIAFFQYFTTIPLYFSKSLKLSEDMIGLIMAYNGILIVLLEMPMVHQLEKRGRLMLNILIGCVLMVLSYLVILPDTGPLTGPILYMTLVTFSEIFAMPFMINFALTRASHGRQGQYMGLYTIAYGIAHIIAPMLGMRLADSLGFFQTFAITAGFSFLVVLGFYLLRRKNPQIA